MQRGEAEERKEQDEREERLEDNLELRDAETRKEPCHIRRALGKGAGNPRYPTLSTPYGRQSQPLYLSGCSECRGGRDRIPTLSYPSPQTLSYGGASLLSCVRASRLRARTRETGRDHTR